MRGIPKRFTVASPNPLETWCEVDDEGGFTNLDKDISASEGYFAREENRQLQAIESRDVISEPQ